MQCRSLLFLKVEIGPWQKSMRKSFAKVVTVTTLYRKQKIQFASNSQEIFEEGTILKSIIKLFLRDYSFKIKPLLILYYFTLTFFHLSDDSRLNDCIGLNCFSVDIRFEIGNCTVFSGTCVSICFDYLNSGDILLNLSLDMDF